MADALNQSAAFPPASSELRQVSRSVPRKESKSKASGTAEYIYNLRLPGMLTGKIFRSTLPHARILSIDTSAAMAVEGVEAVLTAEDMKAVAHDIYYGPAFHDQPVLADEKVRYVGEPVALVLAADPTVAEEAADLIQVEYEPLDPVFNEVEAAQPGAPILHDVLKPAGMFTDLKHLKGRSGTNIALDAHVLRGDPEKGFAASDRVFEHTFHNRKAVHVPLEPFVTVAEMNNAGGITIHSSTQSPSFARAETARVLGWPENRVRVRTAFLGGGFGAKLYMKLEALTALATVIVRQPVRIALTMEEQFYVITKHAATVRIKTGVSKAGRILAREVEVWWNGGAYADIGPRVTQKSGFTAAGPYDIDNVRLTNYQVYTNEPPAGALRGFGIPQVVWAYECQSDIIAKELGIDPVEFRRRNLLVDGGTHATGTVVYNCRVGDVLDRIVDKLDWAKPMDRGTGTVRRGRGVGLGIKASISPTTSTAIINIYSDGSCGLYCSTVDMGQGSDTAMSQVVAEVLGLEAEDILVVHPDTDVTPYDMATLGSRSTFHMGNAVKLAAEDARRQLIDIAAQRLNVAADQLCCEQGGVVAPSGAKVTFFEIMVARFQMQAGNVVGFGAFTPTYAKPDPATGQSPNVTPYWMVNGVGAEVEVDTETGRVKVTKLVNVGDVGRAINPATVKRQLTGAAVMQLGITLFEEMLLDGGQVVNASFGDYKISGILDVPADLTGELVEVPHENGPFGAKGCGESGTFGISPAIANALFDAVGVRMMDAPFTPERVLRALREKAGAPLGDE